MHWRESWETRFCSKSPWIFLDFVSKSPWKLSTTCTKLGMHQKESWETKFCTKSSWIFWVLFKILLNFSKLILEPQLCTEGKAEKLDFVQNLHGFWVKIPLEIIYFLRQTWLCTKRKAEKLRFCSKSLWIFQNYF